MDTWKTGECNPSETPDNDSCWEREFSEKGKLWGDAPGELARVALALLKTSSFCGRGHTLIDLGCGYGRDSLFLAKNCPINIYGIDSSATAIDAARRSAQELDLDPGMFHCGNFLTAGDIPEASVVYSSNVYQILRPGERAGFRDKVREVLKHNGIFILGTLSVNDPEHQGKGVAVDGEAHSIIEPETGKYLHLCTREEIAVDFAFLKQGDLFELGYAEQRIGGAHHHRSWILVAYNKSHFR